MHIIEGQIELFQNSIPNKHIDLDFIMDFVNKLYQTRRVARRFDIPEAEKFNHIYLKYPTYGKKGEYFLEDSDVFPESIIDINDCGTNMSLWCPFYIEQNEENKYFLKFDEYPKGNNIHTIGGWLKRIHERFFFLNDIHSIGELTITNDDEDVSKTYYLNEEGITSLNYKNEMAEVASKSRMERNVANGRWDKYNYYPKIFDYMAEDIEQNLNDKINIDKKKVNNLDNNIKNKIIKNEDTYPEMN
jgi:hypothetical protein